MSQRSLHVASPRSEARSDRIDFDNPALLGGRCANCSYTMWPRRTVCSRCGSRTIIAERLGPAGTLLTWTRVWTPLAGLEVPYTLGLVQLGSVRVFAHIRAQDHELGPGAHLQLTVNPESVPVFWFEIATDKGAGAL